MGQPKEFKLAMTVIGAPPRSTSELVTVCFIAVEFIPTKVGQTVFSTQASRLLPSKFCIE